MLQCSNETVLSVAINTEHCAVAQPWSGDGHRQSGGQNPPEGSQEEPQWWSGVKYTQSAGHRTPPSPHPQNSLNLCKSQDPPWCWTRPHWHCKQNTTLLLVLAAVVFLQEVQNTVINIADKLVSKACQKLQQNNLAERTSKEVSVGRDCVKGNVKTFGLYWKDAQYRDQGKMRIKEETN